MYTNIEITEEALSSLSGRCYNHKYSVSGLEKDYRRLGIQMFPHMKVASLCGKLALMKYSYMKIEKINPEYMLTRRVRYDLRYHEDFFSDDFFVDEKY